MFYGADPLLTLATVLVVGVASGALAVRLRLPAVTGQILAGILIGPSALSVFEAEGIEGLQPITHFALGLIAVTVGSHLHLRRLRNAARRLTWLLLMESTLTPLVVLLAILIASDASWILACLL